MARWRAEALKYLPELREQINASDQIMAFWIEALGAFQLAYEKKPRDESLISRIYSFADWCVNAPRGVDAGHDPFTAVGLAFYEDIPMIPAAREDMPRWFTYSEIAESKQIFSYLIGQAGYQDLLHHMDKNRGRYVPRGRKIDKAISDSR